MASPRTLQTAANALRLGAYRAGVAASSSSSPLLLRSAAPRAGRRYAPAPLHAAAALPSGVRGYSQQQPKESRIWSFEEVCRTHWPFEMVPPSPIPCLEKETRGAREAGIATDWLTSCRFRPTGPEAHARG